MGRSSKVKRKAKVKVAKTEESRASKASETETAPKYSVDQLVDKATEAIDTFNYEIAQKFCQRALEIEPDNLKVLETSGTLLLELGNVDGAKHCFGRAVELSPDVGHSKYMYLGQLFTGAEAIQCFVKGTELMLVERDRQSKSLILIAGVSTGNQDEKCITNRDVSNAYCSVAELWMTDCCDEEEADDKCHKAIQKAISEDNSNPEAYQLYASYLLVKQNVEEAKKMINQSVLLWLPKARELDKPSCSTTKDEDLDVVSPVAISYQTRIQTSQILTEVGEYDTACEVLEGLLDENDEMVQVWHLLGWVHYQQGEDYYNNARHYLNKAKEVMSKTGDDDQEMVQHIDELLEKIGPGPSQDPDDDVTQNGDHEEAVDDEADSDWESDPEDKMDDS